MSEETKAEERQTLLSGESARESEDERPPALLPPQLPPQPSALQSVPLHHPLVVPPEQPPPAYELPAYSEVKPVGIPVQLQLDGRTVTATLIQEPQGKHLVFVGDGGGGGSAQTARPPPPRDYLGLALLGLLCCCFPLGMVALLRSLEVHRLYRLGDYSGAQKASKQAQSWGMAAVIFGLCVFVLPVIMRLYFANSYHHVNIHYDNHNYDY
jgi:hypothetical protein